MVKRYGLSALGLVLIVVGSLLASAIQTSNGVAVTDVRYPGEAGEVLSGLLYIPAGASTARPAPAVLVSHGFINTREMQSPFAIELSRRGFVVLAMDMAGHGYSGGHVGEDGYGGPSALRYLRSLDFVDKSNIGLEGHSMGGAPVIDAALAFPSGYKSVVLEGSTTGFLGGPGEGSVSFPHDLLVVMGRFDEFAPLMWQTPKGSLVNTSARMKAIFGTSGPVVPGRIYGDLAAGTARALIVPPVDHPQEHFTKVGIAPAIDWFQKTLTGEQSPRSPKDQIWIWKEVGTLLGFIGCVTLILGTFKVFTDTIFPALGRRAEPTARLRTFRWWVFLSLSAGIPAASFYLFMALAPQLFFTPFALTKTLPFAMKAFPEQITNQIVIWALLNGSISLILARLLRRDRPSFTHNWGLAAGSAAASVAVGYLALAIVAKVFTVDFRFWILGLKPLDGPHFALFLIYLGPFVLFFLMSLRGFCQAIPVRGEGLTSALLAGAGAMSLGFVVLLAVQYLTMWRTGLLATPSEPLNTIIAFQFIPLLAVVGIIAAASYRWTNDYAPGAFVCALFVTWYMVAGTAVFAPRLGLAPPPRPPASAPAQHN